MDIKPSNIVIDTEDNAVLIGIAGTGATYEWVAPELRQRIPPLDIPFEARCWNDLWAFGKLLFELAKFDEKGTTGKELRQIAEDLTRVDPARGSVLMLLYLHLRITV